jgi:asparaginyl-tRNA synthetase
MENINEEYYTSIKHRIINVTNRNIHDCSYLEKFKHKYTDSYITIANLFKSYQQYLDTDNKIIVKGWIQTSRKQSNNLFIQLYDGSYGSNLQIIFNTNITSLVRDQHDNNSNIINNLHAGTTIMVTGKIVTSPAQGQLFEMTGLQIEILGPISNPATYLPCVKGIKIENLRDKNHIRPKFQSMRAIYRIRNCIIQGLHQFFKLHNCFQLDPNVITTSDCEGAGEVFTITTQFNDLKSNNLTVDFSKDFFNKQAFLTVSSQLQLEALCAGMAKVYTMNPSFRAEPSQTNRHVACFTHVEWELAFIDLKQLLDFNEDIISYVISYVLDNAIEDLIVLDKFVSQGIINKLKSTLDESFVRITYTEALDILHEHIDELQKKYHEFSMPKWGDDLGSNCERFLTDIVYKKPVIVYNYPKILKSFYMKQNEDDPRTVQSCDLLIPGVGEVIGSSIREDDYDKLISVMKNKSMKLEPLQWYLDLRKNATFPHGGAGLGMDRLVAYCTFMECSIRDVIPFPVAYEFCNY